MGYFCDVMTGPLWRSHYRSGNSFLAKNHGMCLSLGCFWILYTYSAYHCNYIAYDIHIRIRYIESRLYFINGWSLPNFFPTSPGMFGSTFQHKLRLMRSCTWTAVWAGSGQPRCRIFWKFLPWNGYPKNERTDDSWVPNEIVGTILNLWQFLVHAVWVLCSPGAGEQRKGTKHWRLLLVPALSLLMVRLHTIFIGWFQISIENLKGNKGTA